MTYRRAGNSMDTFANRPTAGRAGRIHICTDGPLSFIDTGSTWNPIRVDGQRTSTPSVSTLTAINAGGRATTLQDARGGIFMEETNPAAADDYRLAVISAPAAPYVFTVHVHPTLLSANYSGGGIVFRNSSNGSIHVYMAIINGNALQQMIRYETANNNGNSPTYTNVGDSPAGTLLGYAPLLAGDGLWMRIADDNTNKIWSFSSDGYSWMTTATQARATNFTPDQFGIVIGNVNSASGLGKVSAFFSSWKVT